MALLKKSSSKSKKTAVKKKSANQPKSIHKSFRLTKKKPSLNNKDLPTSWRLMGRTYMFLVRNWRKMGGIALIYGLVYILFIRVGSDIALSDYEELIEETFGEEVSARYKTFTLAGIALSSAGQPVSDLQAFQAGLLIAIGSLAFIWALRNIFAGKKFKIRDAFYRSQTPLIPYVMTFIIMSIQLIPFIIGGLIYSIVQAQNITVSGAEDILFALLWAGLGLLSFYWITNTTMAIYAVTLPGMYPMQALRATKPLIEYRRWFVMRKVLFLPIVLILGYGLGFLFTIEVWRDAVFWYIDLAAITAIPITHTYLYHLYRSLV